MKLFLGIIFSLAWVTCHSIYLESKTRKCNLYISLEKHRKSDEFTDVIFYTTDNLNVTAHRVVLSAESPGFKKIFEIAEEEEEGEDPDNDFEMIADQPMINPKGLNEGTTVRRQLSKVVKSMRKRTSSSNIEQSGRKYPIEDQNKGMWPNQVKLPELSLKHLQIPIRSNKKKEPAKLMTKPSEKKKLKYCQCLKLEIEVPHEKETMESLFELCYIGYTDAKNIDSLVDALLEYEIDSPIQDIAEKAIDSLKPFTVENLLKKARRLLQGEVDSEVAKTIMRKVKTRKDFPKFTKHLPLKMLIEYIDDNELTSEDQNTIIVDRLENVDDQEKQVEKNKINQLIDNLDLERMNCSELERLTNVLAQRQIDTRTVLQKVMQMSLKGTGKCHSACGECLREYLYNTKFHYEPGQWNTTTLLKPQSIKGQEAMLGSFLIDEEEFITVFQRDALSSDDNCVDGLVLYRQTKSNGLNPVGESEFDMEIIIDPKGKNTHDCPLRNRLRYKFDHEASTYKWNTKIDFGQPQDVYIKMNPVK